MMERKTMSVFPERIPGFLEAVYPVYVGGVLKASVRPAFHGGRKLSFEVQYVDPNEKSPEATQTHQLVAKKIAELTQLSEANQWRVVED